MHHLTTYRTSGWPVGPPHATKGSRMDPTLARVLSDTHLAAPPPMRRRRPRTGIGGPRLRPRLALAMRRLADRVDAPTVRPEPCR